MKPPCHYQIEIEVMAKIITAAFDLATYHDIPSQTTPLGQSKTVNGVDGRQSGLHDIVK